MLNLRRPPNLSLPNLSPASIPSRPNLPVNNSKYKRMKYNSRFFSLPVPNAEMRFSDKINRRLLLKGALVTGPESSHDCDKRNKKLILEEKKLILYPYLRAFETTCTCIMAVQKF